MCREQLGFAESTPASEEDILCLSAFEQQAFAADSSFPHRHSFYLEAFQHAFSSPDAYPIYRVTISDASSPVQSSINSCQSLQSKTIMPPKEFLIGRPSTGSQSVVDRSRYTRGYLAFDLQDRCLRFLKDSWRPKSDKIAGEKEVYARLHACGVSNIAAILCGVVKPSTMGQVQPMSSQYSGGDSVASEKIALTHYRVVFEKFYRPLSSYSSSRELVAVLADALKG